MSRPVASLVAQTPFEFSGIVSNVHLRSPVVGVERLDEAADAVFAAVGAEQDQALDGGRRHRFGIALLGIGDVLRPFDFAGLGVERDQLGVERRNIDLVAIDRDAAIVRAAAIGRDRTHLVLVFPHLLARLGVERIDVVERGRDIHHAVDDDRRSLHRIENVGLEYPGDMQALDVARGDLLGGMEARLRVVSIGLQEIGAVVGRLVEQVLRDAGRRWRLASCPSRRP